MGEEEVETADESFVDDDDDDDDDDDPELLSQDSSSRSNDEPIEVLPAEEEECNPHHDDIPHQVQQQHYDDDLLYSKLDEQFDINATLEHLIVSGNYYRHQQWRISEYDRLRSEQQQQPCGGGGGSCEPSSSGRSSPPPPPPPNINVVNTTRNEGNPTHKRPRRDPNDSSRRIPFEIGNDNHHHRHCDDGDNSNIVSSSAPVDSSQLPLLHSQDARWYNNVSEKNDGMEPDPWPKLPFTVAMEAVLTDAQYDIEVSDAAAITVPIVGRRARLRSRCVDVGGVVEEPPRYGTVDDNNHSGWTNNVRPPPMDDNLDATNTCFYGLYNNENTTATTTSSSTCGGGGGIQSNSDAVRAMVLQCWNRAVHTAATTTIVVVPPSPPNDNEDATLQSSNTSTSRPSSINNKNKHIRRKRTRDEAIITCQKLRIHAEYHQSPPPPPRSPQQQQNHTNVDHATLSSNRHDRVDHFNANNELVQCSMCRNTFQTTEMLHDHFYGSRTDDDATSGDDGRCGWWSIEQKRQTTVASILEWEVATLTQQLLRHALFFPETTTTTPTDRRRSSNGFNSNDNVQPPQKSIMDGFDVLHRLEQSLLPSRKILKATRRTDDVDDDATVNVVLETLEVTKDESPLPINDAIVEAVRYRLIDRYGKIPR